MVDVYWFGQSSFKIKGKGAQLITDPYDSAFSGLKFPKVEADIVTVSHSHRDHSAVEAVQGNPFVLQGPGEYEVKGISIVGVGSFHDKKEGAERGKNTLYNITIDDLNFAHMGDLGHLLNDSELEELGEVDVLFVPVGGLYTIEADDAAKLVSQIEPKIVVPMHYKIEGLAFQLDGVEKFLKEMGKENLEVQPKLSVSKEKLPEELQVAILEKSK
ncbi:MAG: hypothetical protein A2Y57_04325 [Candidatus Woykebacteria bacterium RBG_13_40_7b]|uniref:Lactamase n=1 Tax=Candidatus Woykebacteria bacterium RBG_13_40_7b TaxID=1802594 RepID=A0A1G1W999_9BACT|nr:MAG: hypothetical protein A2Y57_04325 [Candidatus Woykebacteria bacterium RBG_13_40_7b]